MATESNLNNYTSNISGTNIDNSSNEINPESKSRLDEFSQPKKVYYLASCDENIQMLKKEQEEGLTNILLTLKKEHDNIKMESKRIADETERLEKKITMIQQMDAKTGKKNFDSKIENENIKKAIEATKERLKEEEYKKKTLTALLSKIKKDINLNEISLQKSYDKQNILNQRLQKEKLLQNEIKAKGNQIKSQIIIQQDKNKHDLGEYKLQVKYYNTIIDQKLEFIRAAEERKERQIKIAQDAKKTSGDKDENEKREKLEILYLINNYLQKKMENELEKNRDIEDAFSRIRLICGTNNLKSIIEKVLLKDKKYNYTIKQINEKEQEKKKLTKEIEELNKKFMNLRNEIVVDDDSVAKKDIQIIKSKDVEATANNETLLNEEITLNEKYNLNKELNNLVNLRYDQVVNSLRKLCTEESKNYMRDVSLNASKMGNINQSTNNVNEDNIPKGKEEIKEDELENEEKEKEENQKEENQNEMNTEQQKENEEQNQQQQNEDLKDLKENITQPKDNEEKLQTNNEAESRNKQNNEEIEIINNSKIIKHENNPISNEELNTNNNLANINNSTTVNINMSGFGSVSLLEQEEEAKLIKSYKEYLAQAEKTIDALFLMKTKNDFLQMIRDKASEFDEANKTLKIIKKVQDSTKNSRGSVSKGLSKKSDQNSELEYVQDEESSKEKEIQDKIFMTYINAERRKMEKFINNEREIKFIKKSSATVEPNSKIYSELYYLTDGMDMYWTQLSDLEDQAILQFITGARSLDTWDQFCADWHAQGGDDILQLAKDFLGD